MLPSGLPEQLGEAEPLSRFITSDSQFNNLGPKPSAFMPGPVDNKTSVYRQGDRDLPSLWAMADQVIAPARRVRAVTVLSVADVRAAQLEMMAQEPPPRHANIVGWPDPVNDVELARAQRKGLAQLLTQSSRLIRR